MNRLRRAYLTLEPGLERYLTPDALAAAIVVLGLQAAKAAPVEPGGQVETGNRLGSR
jgi:hypothetical protein